MWVLTLATVSLLLGRLPASPLPAPPASDLDMFAEILEELEELPLEEREDDAVTPELLDLYQDVELLYEMQKSNITDSREGRGFLSKLSFLTGLKLGSFLTGSGTLAASQSINFLGKILNAALSISYGSIDTYPGLGIGEPGIGLQKLPVIVENVPIIDKQREKPDGPLETISEPSLESLVTTVRTPDTVRKDFLEQHNHRVENFNDAFDKKVVRSRTGRIETPKSDKIS
ncbi:uncharacterized protein LOC124362354 [Homalodisca vitripennis]|uniref:uncharacterized protein LOC124362354 n=1 Tax=Homalodisca vitripennis TaxID=197043 RepID=UPI001EEA3AEF|nr:uncharacterized protein LOC124362354 [Homalodisca vitripennis]